MSTAEIRNMKRVWGRLDRAGEGKVETSIPVAGSKSKKKGDELTDTRSIK